MWSRTFGLGALLCLLGAIGPNPRYLEELRIGGGYGESGDGGADFEKNGDIATDGHLTLHGNLAVGKDVAEDRTLSITAGTDRSTYLNFYEVDADNGGALWFDGAVGKLYVGTRHLSSTPTPALEIPRGSEDVGVAGTLTVSGNLAVPEGEATIGSSGVVRGLLTTWSGSGGTTPGVWKTVSADGTSSWFFAANDGSLRRHNALPTANDDGVMIGPAPDDDFHSLPGETAIAADDTLLIHDASAAAYRKITHSDFLCVWMPVELSAGGGTPAVTGGCGGPTKAETATHKNLQWYLDFDASVDETACWAFVLPDNYVAGTTLRAHLVWTADAGTPGQTVYWNVNAVATGDDDPLDADFNANTLVLTDALLATGDHHCTSIGYLTINGTPQPLDLVNIRVKRDADNASDTLAADARLIFVYLEYKAKLRAAD